MQELAAQNAATNSSGRSSVRVSGDSGGSVSVSSDLDPRSLVTIGVEIWLVHRLPNGAEESQLRTVQTVPGDGSFEFDAVPITLSDVSYTVEVKGLLQAQRTADGSENLDVGLIRRVTALGITPRIVALGGTGRFIATPRAGEVTSLELPAPSRGDVPLGGHQFSLRIRVVR
jgi:hypothetical protein